MSQPFWRFSLPLMATQTSLWIVFLHNILSCVLLVFLEMLSAGQRRRLELIFLFTVQALSITLDQYLEEFAGPRLLTPFINWGFTAFYYKESKFFSNVVFCNEWDPCYLDFAVETSHGDGHDSISQLNPNTALKGYEDVMKQTTLLNPNCYTRIQVKGLFVNNQPGEWIAKHFTSPRAKTIRA